MCSVDVFEYSECDIEPVSRSFKKKEEKKKIQSSPMNLLKSTIKVYF